MVTPHLLLWSAVTLGIIQTWRFFKRSRLITKTPYSSSLLHYLRYLFKASVLYYTSVTEIHTGCCGLNPSTMMLLTCCLIWLFNMVQSELALESQVKDVSCFLNSLTVCTCIIPGTTVPELSLACWFWTTSLHFFFIIIIFFSFIIICLLTVYFQVSQMKTWDFVLVLQSVSVTFKTLCPFNMQVSTTLYASEMCRSVYFPFHLPQNFIASISKWR